MNEEESIELRHCSSCCNSELGFNLLWCKYLNQARANNETCDHWGWSVDTEDTRDFDYSDIRPEL